MLKNLKSLTGFKVIAMDGVIGKVHDFYFNDETWSINYLVVNTGAWFLGRKILIYPAVIGQPDWESHKLPVKLTKELVKKSPNVNVDKPVSRQNRVKLNKTHGTIELTGCTVSELKKHIEKQFNNEMSWENHGIYWHLDHIIPCSAFDLTKKTEQFVCFNYRNLQPLECIVNLTKSNKYNIKDKKQLYKKVIL